MGVVVNVLTQEAEILAAEARRDVEIMAREYEGFPIIPERSRSSCNRETSLRRANLRNILLRWGKTNNLVTGWC
jgi:hypothetical protein